MSGRVLDELDVMMIELQAISACCERPDFDESQPPAKQMTDDDYRAGIRKHFAEVAEFSEDLVDPLLAEVREEIRLRERVQGFCEAIIMGVMGR